MCSSPSETVSWDQREVQNDDFTMNLLRDDFLETSRVREHFLRKNANQLLDNRFELLGLLGDQVKHVTCKNKRRSMRI